MALVVHRVLVLAYDGQSGGGGQLLMVVFHSLGFVF